MNIIFFKEGLDLLSYSGFRLSCEQSALIENSLILLQNENKFENIFFWGRINGIENDYFIAFGYLKDCLRGRRFFYSTNCFDWVLMPPHNPELFNICLACTSKFHGDPTIILDVLMDPQFVVGADGVNRPLHPELRKIKEEDRLTCMVSMITEESALLPRGALYKRVDRKTVYNPVFNGFKYHEAKDLINYQLYRMPRYQWNANLIKRQCYNYATDYFDTVDNMVPPENSFSITINRDNQIVFVKSLHWPGMFFFHKLMSKKHGFVYFGDAKKNFDILFML